MVNIIPFKKWYTDDIRGIDKEEENATSEGFVYLIKLKNGVYKIGWTKGKSLAGRMSYLLSKDIKDDFYIDYLIETNAPKSLEEKLFGEFKGKKASFRTEYFALNEDDVKQALSIAISTSQLYDEIKRKKLESSDPTSIVAYLEWKFKDDHIVEVAYVLASIGDVCLSSEELQNMTLNKWSKTTINNSIRMLRMYNYIDVKKEKRTPRYCLNELFWKDFRSRRDHDQLARLYRMGTLIKKAQNIGASFDVHIRGVK